MSWEYSFYSRKLEQILNQLRKKYLGQDISLDELAPGGSSLPPDQLAERCAQILAFHLTRAKQLTDAELSESWHWLHAACCFILSCPSNSWMLYNLVNLMSLNSEQLASLISDRVEASQQLVSIVSVPPASIKENLEEAIWSISKPTVTQLNPLEELCSD